MFDDLTDRAMKLRDKTLIQIGVVDAIQRLRLNENITARFRVKTANELHRTRNAAGEMGLIDEFIRNLPDGTVFWDIGAAVGTWSCLLGAAGYQVVAFEPHPKNADRLRENVRLNGLGDWIDVEEVALANSTGKTTLSISGDVGSGGHHILAEADGDIEVRKAQGDEYRPPPTAFKMDVEGAELSALDGMGDYLKGVDRALVEVHPQYGIEAFEVINGLEEAGLSTEVLDADRTEEFVLARR